MEVVKVGDIFEFTIIALDKDRKRISLSLKSDAASRIGQTVATRAAARSAEGTGDVKRKVVVVKKGSLQAGSPAASRDAGNRASGANRGGNRSYGSDDGMSYNPFAALLKK